MHVTSVVVKEILKIFGGDASQQFLMQLLHRESTPWLEFNWDPPNDLKPNFFLFPSHLSEFLSRGSPDPRLFMGNPRIVRFWWTRFWNVKWVIVQSLTTKSANCSNWAAMVGDFSSSQYAIRQQAIANEDSSASAWLTANPAWPDNRMNDATLVRSVSD
jgi:hypothetical protein